MEKRKHRGMLILLLGGVLMLLGACLLAGMDNLMQYVMPAPASTQEGGELEALYEEGQKQLEAMADALFSGAIGARKQSVSLAAENGQSVQAALYAVGVGYFDVLHETLQNGRLISEMDIEKAQDVIVLDESAALTLFAGDDPVGGRVTLEGQQFLFLEIGKLLVDWVASLSKMIPSYLEILPNSLLNEEETGALSLSSCLLYTSRCV